MNSTGRKLRQELYDGSTLKKKTDYAGEFYYENDTLKFINHEEGRIVMTGQDPEYQYFLKDHLRNVRVTFTSKEEVESVTATLETGEQTDESAVFLNYDAARRVNSTLFDHTDTASTHYALRLSGSPTETYGLARSIAVVPGDVISASVYAKYVDPNQGNLTTALQNLLTSIAAGTASSGTVIDGPSYGGSGAGNNPYALLLDKSGEAGDAPKAYLNYLVFDKNFNLILSRSGYQRMSTAAREDGLLAPQGVAHELLQTVGIHITEPGYVYIYLSNEEPGKEVYFDDFKVRHEKSAIVQSEEYYPFGLTFNGYQRENSLANRFKFQGQEHIDDLGLGWDSFKWRNHQPDIGRFFNVDPLSEKYYYNSPYAFSENQVVAHRELEGLEKVSVNDEGAKKGTQSMNAATAVLVVANGPGRVIPQVGVVLTAGLMSWKAGKEFGNKVGERFNEVVTPLLEMLKSESSDKVKEKSIGELEPLHPKELTEKTGKDVTNLSDEDLLNSANNPQNGDYLLENTETGTLMDGNTRANELKKRANDPDNKNIQPDTKVKVKEYTPDNSMFDF